MRMRHYKFVAEWSWRSMYEPSCKPQKIVSQWLRNNDAYCEYVRCVRNAFWKIKITRNVREVYAPSYHVSRLNDRRSAAYVAGVSFDCGVAIAENGGRGRIIKNATAVDGAKSMPHRRRRRHNIYTANILRGVGRLEWTRKKYYRRGRTERRRRQSLAWQNVIVNNYCYNLILSSRAVWCSAQCTRV